MLLGHLVRAAFPEIWGFFFWINIDPFRVNRFQQRGDKGANRRGKRFAH